MIQQLLGDNVQDSGRYIAEVIYGANDGIVTTFAVVSGVAGAALNPSIVLILGIANLFADGFSMGMSNFLSRRSELDYESTRSNGANDGSLGGTNKPPAKTAFATFVAFVVAGWTPLIPYILVIEPLFLYSAAFTGLAFFTVGASRSLVTDRAWYINGTEMLLVGMLAATVAYLIGTLLSGLA